jgi:hypothetical protein
MKKSSKMSKGTIFKVSLSLYIDYVKYTTDEEEEFEEEYKNMKKTPLQQIAYDNRNLNEDDENYDMDNFMIENDRYKDLVELLAEYELPGKVILSHYEDETISFVIKLNKESKVDKIVDNLLWSSYSSSVYNDVSSIPSKSNPLMVYGSIDFRNKEYINVELIQ